MTPSVLDNATLSYVISGAPGKFIFKVYKDETLDFAEGDTVQVLYDEIPIFFGFVFAKKRNKDKTIEVVTYDQLRYLKNKDSITYKNKKASDLIKMLAGDFKLKCGEIKDSEFVIKKRTEDNATLLDMIQWALDFTTMNTKKLFVLYDDCEKLMLKEPSDLFVPYLIDNETAQDFSYESSIDKDVYNLVKLVQENAETGEHQIFYAPKSSSEYANSENFKRWGVIQYYEKLTDTSMNPQMLANELLKYYNEVSRNISISNAIGDIRVRAGSMIAAALNLGDVKVAQKMLVTEVKHTFSNNEHMMNLKLKGGIFNAK